MKLLNKRNAHFDKSTQQLLKLLEYNTVFEKAVWIARANLGIKPSNLLYPQELPENLKDDFDKTWQERQLTPTVDEIHDITKPLDDLPSKEFTRRAKTDEGSELIIKSGYEEQKLHERILLHSAILLDGFTLPINWLYPTAQLIRFGSFITHGSTEPFSIYVDTKWLRTRGISGTNFTNLIPYFDQQPQGVQIVISAKIKRKNELIEWIDKNWDKIQQVMGFTNLPDNWSPKLRKLDQTVGIIELQRQFPKKPLSQIIELYEENLPETLDSNNETIKQEIKEFRKNMSND